MRLAHVVLAVLVGLAIWLGAPAPAHAKAKVEIAAVEVTPAAQVDKTRDDKVRRSIRRLAAASLKHLDFGKTGKVEATLVVKELKFEESDGLLRITCTLVGKIKGGGTAKSRISFGGKPDKKKQLEKQVLGAVTDGVMTRLAELARAKEKAG